MIYIRIIGQDFDIELSQQRTNLSSDPAETIDLVNEKPELVKALEAEYLKRTEKFKPPVNWKYGKWEQIAGRALE